MGTRAGSLHSRAKELHLSGKAAAPCGGTWEGGWPKGWLEEGACSHSGGQRARVLHGHAADLVPKSSASVQRMLLPCRSRLFNPWAKVPFPSFLRPLPARAAFLKGKLAAAPQCCPPFPCERRGAAAARRLRQGSARRWPRGGAAGPARLLPLEGSARMPSASTLAQESTPPKTHRRLLRAPWRSKVFPNSEVRSNAAGIKGCLTSRRH